MIPFRTLCSRLRAAIKGMTPDVRASLGVLPKCVEGGSSYSYRVDASAFLSLCLRLEIDPKTGERKPLEMVHLACLLPAARLEFWQIGAGFAVKRRADKLSLRAASEVCGVSASTLARLEQGLPISIESVLAVCEFIGVHPFGYLRRERKVQGQEMKRAA